MLEPDDESAFRSALEAFSEKHPDTTFAFDYEPDTDFADYTRMLRSWSQGIDVPERFVPNTFLVAFVGDEIVGRVSIRHELNDFLIQIGGNIGYSVIPSWEGRGVATEMLRQALGYCAELGIERALLSCFLDNLASRRVIEKNGGAYDGLGVNPDTGVPERRYWIDTKNR